MRLETWIWRNNLWSTVLPIVFVVTAILAAFVSASRWAEGEMSGYWREEADKQLRQSAGLEADLIDQKLMDVSGYVQILASYMADCLKTPAELSPELASSLKYSPEGAYYTAYNTGGATVYYSGFVPVGEEQRRKAARALKAQDLMRDIYMANPIIASVYLNTFDSMTVIYPYVDAKTYFVPGLDVREFSFYYEADMEHNPGRGVKWTGAYLDPAGHGWIASCLCPVYSGDFLEGVVGVDVTVRALSGKLLELKLPWEGYGMLLGGDGTILVASRGGLTDLGLSETEEGPYETAVIKDTFRPEAYNIYTRDGLKDFADEIFSSEEGILKTSIGGEGKVVAWDTVGESGWKLLVVIPERNIYAKIGDMASRMRSIGLSLLAGAILFNIGFVLFVYSRGKKFAGKIMEPLSEISGMAKSIGEGRYYQKAKECRVKEFAETLENLVAMGERLGQSNRELLRAQSLLEESKRYLQAVLDSTDDIILEIGRDCETIRVVASSPGGLAQGVKGMEIRSRDYMGPGMLRQLRETVGKIVETGRPVAIDYEVMTPFGRRWFVARMTRIDTSDPKVIVSVRDITERKELEESIMRAKDEAEAANRAKSQFLSAMSHELRTPLNAILGFAQVLEMGSSGPLTEEQMECVGEIIRAGTHLLELINDVLDLARIEAGKVRLSLERVDVSDVMEEASALIQPLAEKHGIAVRTVGCCPDEKYVRADRTRLRQILLNLLQNAVKYNKPDGEVLFYCDQAGDMVRFHVVDTGIGLSEENARLIFNPFYRVEGVSSSADGIGVGLSVVKQLTEAMGGSVHVSSALGEGSHFCVELPASPAPEDYGSERAARNEGGTAGAGGEGRKKVLYIEDNPVNVRIVECLLCERQNIELCSAPTGEEGLAAALKEPPDLILLDINLPGMDGYEVFSRLRAHARTRGIPVVAVSSNAAEGEVKRAMDMGFAGYMAKPFKFEGFVEKIEGFLSG